MGTLSKVASPKCKVIPSFSFYTVYESDTVYLTVKVMCEEKKSSAKYTWTPLVVLPGEWRGIQAGIKRVWVPLGRRKV